MTTPPHAQAEKLDRILDILSVMQKTQLRAAQRQLQALQQVGQAIAELRTSANPEPDSLPTINTESFEPQLVPSQQTAAPILDFSQTIAQTPTTAKPIGTLQATRAPAAADVVKPALPPRPSLYQTLAPTSVRNSTADRPASQKAPTETLETPDSRCDLQNLEQQNSDHSVQQPSSELSDPAATFSARGNGDATENTPRPKTVKKVSTPSRSLYRTLADEKANAADAEAERESTPELPTVSLGQLSPYQSDDMVTSLANGAKRPTNLLEESELEQSDTEEPEVSEAEIKAAHDYTNMLPSVDQLSAELQNANDETLREAAMPVSRTPRKTAPILSAPQQDMVMGKSPVIGREEDTSGPMSVSEAIEMEAADERNLLDQINKFTETLSETTAFWQQVTIPRVNSEAGPAKSADSAGGNGGQYENNSRSPYSC